MISSRKAEYHLLIMTAIWGLTFPIIGTAVKTINPLDFVFLRFLLAAIVMLPFVLKDLHYTNWQTIRCGLLLGAVNLGAYASQSIGLKTISSAESAFITSTCVILVPLILLFFKGNQPKRLDFICSVLCLIGLYILTGAHLVALRIGETLTLLCALCSAISIIIIQFKSHQVSKFHLLVFYQILFTAVFALPFSLNNPSKIIFNTQVITALLFCSLFATIIVFYLQMKFQKYTTAPKAALIYTAEPLFACLFAWLINNENITLNILVGGTVIVIAVLLPDLRYHIQRLTQSTP